MGKVRPNRLPELIQYFGVFAASAIITNFDWFKYDTLFRQSSMVFTEKGWGEPDPTVWLQCYNSGQSGHLYGSNRSSVGPRILFCYNYNRDTCRFKGRKYAHRCMSCRGFHPKFKCPNSSNSDYFEQPYKRREASPSPPSPSGKSRKSQDCSLIMVMKSR